MRRTVTLDPDVVTKLQQTARERGVSFKAALNDAVRAGLGPRAGAARRYRMPARRMGMRPGVEHGALLCSCDADFSRFPGLRWVDPLRG
jgi:hypothetical protein